MEAVTAPDHRPFLRPGVDLITAEDVLAWLDGLTSGPARERIYGVLDAHAALALRLDRERVQACRRGALAAWREFASISRHLSDRGAPDGAILRALMEHSEWGGPLTDEVLGALSDALAFRAAARAK